MADDIDPVVDYLAGIHDAVLAMGVLLKQALDAGALRPAGPVVLADAPSVASSWRCPVHGTSRTVPAGVSKRTGRAFDAFVVCDQQGCDMKPGKPIPQRAIPPSMGGQMP